jgi:hypothetical protein
MNWIACTTNLPSHQQRVLAFVPGNKVFLPGKTGEFEMREVIVLHFIENFYPEGSEKREKHGPHFWQGEGNSNCFFHAVTHWMPLPDSPHS